MWCDDDDELRALLVQHLLQHAALGLEPLERGVVGRGVINASDRVEFPEINGQNVHGNLLSVGVGKVTNYAAV